MDSTKLNQFLAALRPELTNVDWTALARKVLIENPQTALRELPGRLQGATDLLSQYNPGGLLPNQPPTPPDVQEKLTGMAMDSGMAFAPMGVTAWHGSNNLFSMLDKALRGTGEGAQVYGTGAGYTGGVRGVGEFYRDKLGRGEEKIGDVPIAEYYDKLNRQAAQLRGPKADELYAKMDLVETLGLGRTVPEVKAYAQEAGYNKKILDWVDKELMPKFKPAGYLYKGDIPDEILPKFIDWNAPIGQQSKEVKALAKQYGIAMDDLGGDLVAKVGKGPEGSGIMEAAGIRGIKYLDDNSSTAKFGATNYIPFRPEDYKIEEINDIPLEQWFQRGLLEKPMSAKEQAKAAWEANPENKDLYEAYRKLRLSE